MAHCPSHALGKVAREGGGLGAAEPAVQRQRGLQAWAGGEDQQCVFKCAHVDHEGAHARLNGHTSGCPGTTRGAGSQESPWEERAARYSRRPFL